MAHPCPTDTTPKSSKVTSHKRALRTILGYSDAPSPDDWLRPAEVAVQYGVNVRTLKNWRTLGKGPAYSKPSSRVVYRRADVDAYQAQRRVVPRT